MCGKSTGYALISIDQMWYKIHYPTYFWYVKAKYALNEMDTLKYSKLAALDGIVVMLPHVNYSARVSIRKVDGEVVLQQGISLLKGVGLKTAELIEEERNRGGIFKNYDDFYDRCVETKIVNKRVFEILLEHGAAEFNKKTYLKRVVKYNSSLIAGGRK